MRWLSDHLALTTVGTVLAAIVILTIFIRLLRLYSQDATRSLYSTAIVSVTVSVLFSVFLGHVYATRRDRDNRLKQVRDQHFGQLKLVLRTESSNLHEIAVAIKKRAHTSAVVHSEPIGLDVSAMLWPDGLSKDLPRHFPEYDSSKRKLLSDTNIQDQEFRDAVLLAEKSIKDSYALSGDWPELVARSVVDQCTGVGTGIKLTITPDGYHFEHLGGSTSSTGPRSNPPRPSADVVAAFRAFQSLKPDHVLADHCQSLKDRADMIRNAAEELSKNARSFADGTVLSGACDFIHD